MRELAEQIIEAIDNADNTVFDEIEELFSNAGVNNFETLPSEQPVCGQFAKLFTNLNKHLDAAKIQGCRQIPH